MMIKIEPETYDHHHLRFQTASPSTHSQASRGHQPNNPSSRPQSTLLRTLIRTSQTSSLPTKKDAPLYDLLQNLEGSTSTDASVYSSALEQYLTPVLAQTSANSQHAAKDDYLASLLTSDPQRPSEISLNSSNRSQTSNDSSRISALANELFHSTANATTPSNRSNDDFLSLLESKDFLECLNDSTTIDSILSQNSNSVIEPLFPSPINRRNDKDERAISEIYKTLVTSFNPGTYSMRRERRSSPYPSLAIIHRFMSTIIVSSSSTRYTIG